ncbi:MAG: Orotidine 5'-phosphate decarboxylase [Microgenomates group bacterium Gr01-1014_80]|nr:MAG: Orotidine 5'-phosphate decarboxylase [Microgenomates group bacterium Gr01-1014_80]
MYLYRRVNQQKIVPMNSFIKKLENRWQQKKYVCVGLDSDFSKIPQSIKKSNSIKDVLFKFNKGIIDQTAGLVCAFKINPAFYEAEGLEGLEGLKKTVKYINKKYPDIPLILDAKKGDIGNTNLGYTKSIFDDLGFDAVTVNPYLGGESLQPFLDRKDKGIIVLVKTSNPGAGEFQDLLVSGKPLYKVVAKNVANGWNKYGNCGVVVGATYLKELKDVRKIVGDMPILIPGIGTQGGNLKNTIQNGKGKKSWGMIINSSRGIIFADNPRKATLDLHQQITNVIARSDSDEAIL